MAAGKVCGQSPAAGANVNAGSTVNLVISKGLAIYVDGESGDDSQGTGSETNPYETIQKAIQIADDGYTIIITGGNYSAKDFRIDKQVTIKAQNGTGTVRIGQ